MINESEIVFVEESRQSKSFEATVGEVVTKFKKREIDGDQAVRRTIDGEYRWLTVADLCKHEPVTSVAELGATEQKTTLDDKDTPPRTYDVLLCVFGLLSLFGHFASPASIALSGLALFFWIRRKGSNVWYRTVGLVAALISIGGTVFILGAAWLVVVRTWF
jgi:hypothetical protein